MNITVNAAAIKEASEKLSNWGRWGKDDMSGTLNHVTPQDIVEAGKLIKQGKSFALGIPLDPPGRRLGCLAGASIRSTKCWRPAPTRSPASRTGTSCATPTTH
jgi:hypothetical protein